MQRTHKGRFHPSLNVPSHHRVRINEGVSVMYLKKVDGPRAVTLPDGKVFSRADLDLPPPDTVRWVASRKLAVLRGIAFGLIARQEAIYTYGLSDEELYGWVRAAAKSGLNGLKVTAGQTITQP